MADYQLTQSGSQVQTALDKVGTVALNTTATDLSSAVNELQGKIGTDPILTTAQTLTGAVNELNAKAPAIATTSNVGVVKPDGNSVTVDNDGTIHSVTTEAVLLWENSSPTSNFSAQTIPIDVSDYNMFVIDYRATVSVDNHLCSSILRKQGETVTTTLSSVGDNASIIRTRVVTISDTGFAFTDATYWGTYGQTTGQSQTGQVIPQRIWGLTIRVS